MLMQNEVKKSKLHVICERDVGLFSLIQQVIAQIPWALSEKRIPIVYFLDKSAYWTPKGYQDKDTVWEYYFEPINSVYPAAYLSEDIRKQVKNYISNKKKNKVGEFICENIWVSRHFGDDPSLRGKCLPIPYQLNDPDYEIRDKASKIIHKYIHPRSYIIRKVKDFHARYMENDFVIGVHIRGTDSISINEKRNFRKNSLDLAYYYKYINNALIANPEAKIFVATDEENSLKYIKDKFGNKVISYDSIRHSKGETAGKGPLGKIMPAYITKNRDIAARNGEEAIIEYLLLTKCNILIHNGASLARTVLLSCPKLRHINTNPNNKIVNRLNIMSHLIFQETGRKFINLNKRYGNFNYKILKRLRGEIKNTKKYLKNSIRNINKKAKNIELIEKKSSIALDSKLISKVKAKKNEIKRSGHYYNDSPLISLIILSFNHRSNIKPIIESLRLSGAQELIVCEDGSIDGSLEEWMKYLFYPNDFLIRSNDLHEIRSYDRAINLAKGEIVCILQDDDIPPSDNDWIDIPLKLFNRFPKLAVIGGYQGRGFGNYRIYYGYNKQSIPYLDPDLRVPFMFVLGVNVGPIFYRKKAYNHIGGFDYSYSKPGDPGIVFDHELCLKAWLNGWQVGLYEPKGFIMDIGEGGTKTFSNTDRGNHKKKNQARFMHTYEGEIEHYYRITEKLNNSLLVTK